MKNTFIKPISATKSVFLTGADGLLGTHVIQELLTKNYAVTALIENGEEPKSSLALQGVKIVYGNVLNRRQVLEASKNCRYIIHLENTLVKPGRLSRLSEITKMGTLNVINAAMSNRVKRVIYVSSANAFAHGSIGNQMSETTGPGSDTSVRNFIDNTYEAHLSILNAVKNNNLPAVTICPTLMVDKNAFAQDPANKNCIYAGDVASAVINAIKSGEIGETYVLGKGRLNCNSDLSLIPHGIGVKATERKLRNSFDVAYDMICTFISKIVRKQKPVKLGMETAENECFYESSKAEKELVLQ